MKPRPCAVADHEGTKRTLLDFLFRNIFIGVQADDEETLVLANCPACRSTLALPVAASET